MLKKPIKRLKGPRRDRILLTMFGISAMIFLLLASTIYQQEFQIPSYLNGGSGDTVGQKPAAGIRTDEAVITTESFSVRIIILDYEQEVRSYLATLTKVGGSSKEIVSAFHEDEGGVHSVDYWITTSFHEGAGAYVLWLGVSDMDHNYDEDERTIEYKPTVTTATAKPQSPSGGWSANGFGLFMGIGVIVLIIKRRRHHA